MSILITVLHIVVALFLILVVLLQTGKRADLAGAFGGGGSQTAFGTRGAATLLSKLTTGAAVAFMLTSLVLSLLTSKASGPGGTVLEDVQPAETSAPAPTEVPARLPVAPPAEQAPEETAEDAPGPGTGSP